MTGTLCGLAWTGSNNTSQNNIWWCGTDGHCLEYWARCRAGPIQSQPEVRFINCPTLEVEKEKKKEAQSCKLQAASLTSTNNRIIKD